MQLEFIEQDSLNGLDRLMAETGLLDTDQDRQTVTQGTSTDKQFNPFDYARPFDVHRAYDYKEADNAIEKLFDELVIWRRSLHENARRMRERDARAYKRHLKLIVIDLFAAWHSDSELYVFLSTTSNDYSGLGRLAKFGLGYELTMNVLSFLEQNSYISRKAGFMDMRNGIGRRTRIRSTTKLIKDIFETYGLNPYLLEKTNFQSIHMRDADKNDLDYEDNPDITRMRQNLEVINKQIQSEFIYIPLKDRGYSQLRKRLQGRTHSHEDRLVRYLDFTENKLHRVFNEGWDRGGRFYGVWWQKVPSEYRSFIRIGDWWTQEIDFKGMQPYMLYHLLGKPVPFDDPYALEGVDPIHRPQIKKVFMQMLNAPSRKMDRRLEGGLKHSEIVAKIQTAHSEIIEFFNSGEGIRLQALDAKIAELALLDLCSQGITALPVHDSFIVKRKEGYAEAVIEAMKKAYREVMGYEIEVEVEKSLEGKRTHSIIPNPTEVMSNSEKLTSDNLYSFEDSDYKEFRRLVYWRSEMEAGLSM